MEFKAGCLQSLGKHDLQVTAKITLNTNNSNNKNIVCNFLSKITRNLSATFVLVCVHNEKQ